MTKGNPKWERWEKKVQDLYGLDSCPGSGNQFNAPGDAVSNETAHDSSFRLMIDCKYTEKKSYSFTRDNWEKWAERCAEAGKRPAVAVRIHPPIFTGPTSAQVPPIDVVAVDINDLAELVAKAEKLALIEKLYREMPKDPHAV